MSVKRETPIKGHPAVLRRPTSHWAQRNATLTLNEICERCGVAAWDHDTAWVYLPNERNPMKEQDLVKYEIQALNWASDMDTETGSLFPEVYGLVLDLITEIRRLGKQMSQSGFSALEAERDYLRQRVALLNPVAHAAARVEQELNEATAGSGRVSHQVLDDLTSALVEWEKGGADT